MFLTENPEKYRSQLLSELVNVVTNLSTEQLSLVFQKAQKLDSFATTTETIREENRLSQREQEVLILISTGYSRKQMAKKLGITPNTAARHIATIYSKLGFSSIAEATRYAIRHGMS